MSDIGFHRNQMLPPAPPPPGQTGVVRWMRENLFSTWPSVFLTFGSVALLVWIVVSAGPWFWNGIWDASSLDECRDIRDARFGEGVSVACWAFIPERWAQLLFGFYPQGETWRPVVAFALFCAAVAPILYAKLPRRLLWLVPVTPFAMFFLLWGGSLWGPIMVALGFALGWAVFRTFLGLTGPVIAMVAGTLAAIAFWLLLDGPLTVWLTAHVPLWSLRAVPTREFGGFTLSFVIGAAGIVLSLPLGILLALGRQSDMPIIRYSAVAFIEVIRGVPLIVWLFTASLLLNYFLPPGTTFDLMLRVIIMVTLFSAAYIAEIVRGGLASLPRGQYEAADALGLDYWAAMRLIVLPQALKVSIPGIVGSFIGLFKDTTLVSLIGLFDPINLSNTIRSDAAWHGIFSEMYFFIGAIFFVVCFAMSRYSMRLERSLRRDHR